MPKSTIPIRRRLPEALSPALDRSRTVTIYYAGQPIEAYVGDSVASAIYAAGYRLFGRSFKYHRPRGLLCTSGRCPNCLVSIDGSPNQRACMTPVSDGLHVEPENVFPSVDLDLFSIFDKMDFLLPPGFYYKTFIYPRSAWPFYETVLRNIAGLGKLDFSRDPHVHYARRHLHPDVAVIGGGVAGLSAALEAAEAGLRVALVEDNAQLGGYHLGDTRVYEDAGDFSGRSGHQIVTELVDRLRSCDNVEILTGAVAFGMYEDNLVGVAQEGQRTLTELRAGRVVLATGTFEHPLVFQNNDLPGVMLGMAAQRLIRLWGVRPAPRAVVVSAHDEGLRVATDLLDAGVKLAAVAEHRTEVPDGPDARRLADEGVPLLKGWSVARADGKGRVESATLIQLDSAGEPIEGTERRENCSLIAVSTGLETNASLLWQAGCTVAYDESLDLFTPRAMGPGVHVAGDVTGVRGLKYALLSGRMAGSEAVLAITPSPNGRRSALDALQTELAEMERDFRSRVRSRAIYEVASSGGKQFICPCEDITAKDIDWSVAEGFDHIETLKRYSTTTMGPCQGKMCALNTVAACARATGRTIAETGTTTSRPLVVPVSMGTLGGPHLEPTRYTSMHYRQVELGAEMMDAGQWKRARIYTSPEEECRAVRERVGMIDVSTLGKMDLKGPDAVKILERVYTNKWADLKIGRVRYGVMTDEAGIILDDGTVARLGDDHYFITTTSSGASAMEEWITWWLEGTGYCAHITNVTSGYAALNLAGPRSREVLAKLTDLDLSAQALPYLRVVQGKVAGVPAIILRIGFVGELGYEMHFPAEYGEYMWDTLMEAGKEFGIAPFGMEAQRILRLEKGHIIVTQDTDALSTPLEADMSWIVKFDKDDFIGKTSLEHVKALGLNQKLVGFEMLDATIVPDEGCQILRADGYPVGRVTSARYSAALRKSIGLAWVPVSDGAEGTEIRIQLNGQPVQARIVPVPFYDPSGERMKA